MYLFVSFRDIVMSSEYIVSTTAEYGMLWMVLDSLRSMYLLKHSLSHSEQGFAHPKLVSRTSSINSTFDQMTL